MGFGVECLEFKVWGLGSRVQGSLLVWSLGFGILGSECSIEAFEFRVHDSGLGVSNSGFRVWRSMFGVQGILLV